ncbi:acetyltransferase [Shewanella sp. D64]|uniref:acetyltransferase n=1 Tax=unclassified Shewanella TaxID=196818 RepID=UPI0022BA151F|nr:MULTISPECIES: acetyltransferase [unclassified Shewanella]MEC4726562.1 acetyltransferase [Shewanella sp. D64]MEC4737397.1 acetyltransferase [Shewanella sp. E94]WBJ97216.1 acetyltransferase [Shewanella sp. MTB7]
MIKPIIMIGSGGHASVLTDILLQNTHTILAVISPDKGTSSVFNHIQHFDSDDDILQFSQNEVKLVNGLGSLPRQGLRHEIFNYFTQLNFQFETVISQNAMLSPYSTIGVGSQILTGAIIQTGAVIGASTIVNSGAIVEHDCHIGMHCHIAPGATICGNVHIGEHTHIATGANVIQGVSIGKHCIVAAGATVTKDMPDNSIAYGYRSKIEKRS